MEETGYCITPFQRKHLLKNLERDLRPEHRQRIEIMLLADEGLTQAEICQQLGCAKETARHWMSVAQMGQSHRWKERSIGRPKAVTDEYLASLRYLVSCSPRELGYPFRRWTAQWLSQHLANELGISVSACHINRLLKKMGLSTRSQASQIESSIDLQANQRHSNDSILEIRDLA
jgi:putative transposase